MVSISGVPCTYSTIANRNYGRLVTAGSQLAKGEPKPEDKQVLPTLIPGRKF
jgi:hypothetical protein